MRFMGLDVGTRTIGIATSDIMGIIATGIKTIRRTTLERDFNELEVLIKEKEITTIVVGYPKNMNGTIGERAKSCEELAELLRQKFCPVEVVLWDERLTTVAAQRVLIEADLSRNKRKQVVDTVAATVILQNYLDYIGKNKQEE